MRKCKGDGSRFIGLALAGILLAVGVGIVAPGFLSPQPALQASALTVDELKKNDYIYLSDLTYDSSSFPGYKTIMKDANVNGGTIKLRKDGEIVQYPRGMAIHAKGQLVYDLSEYTNEYTHLMVDIGVDADQPTGNGRGEVKVIIHTSDNGKDWRKVLHVGGENKVLNSSMDCQQINLDIKDVKYLKFEIEDHNGNANDHVMLADAKIVKDGYKATMDTYSKIDTLANYTAKITDGQSLDDVDKIYNDHKDDILVREFVSKIGYWSIQNYYNFDKEGSQRVLDWLLDQQHRSRLEYVVEVGEIKDGMKFLQILSSLLNKYNNFADGNEDVYTKIAVALAAANTSDEMASPFSFYLLSANYDVMERFDHLKRYYDDNKMPDKFAEYEISQMRMVVQDPVWEEDMDWLYARTHNWGETYNDFNGGSWWLAYRRPNYANEKYYNLDLIKQNQFDTKNQLAKYNVPFGVDNKVHYWMAFSEGGICWNTSRMGQGVYRVAGLPATGGYQPGHEVFVYYNKNSDGKWVWGMGNNVYGWGRSASVWMGGYRHRLLLDWGNEEYTMKSIAGGGGWANNMGYILLAQANIDDYDTYQTGLTYAAIADMYDNLDDKIKVYEKALEKSGYMNLDSYDTLIRMYEEKDAKNPDEATKNDDKWYNLASHIVDKYAYHTQAMYDLLESGEGRGGGISQDWKGVKSHLTNHEHIADIAIRERSALEAASELTADDKDRFPQWSEIKAIASLLLGVESEPIATFSFDGKHAGEVVVSDSYEVKWGYCINDTECTDPPHGTTSNKTAKLTAEELEAINPKPETLDDENQVMTISLKMEGVTKPFTIEIEPGYVTGVYQNDEEKRLVGNVDNLEWRISKSQELDENWVPGELKRYPDGENWKSYSEEKPDLTGLVKTIEVRPKAHANYRIGKVKSYDFREESYEALFQMMTGEVQKVYIPASMMSIYKVSSEATDKNYVADNLIDGDINTSFYTNWDGSDKERYVIIKLEQPMVISGINYFVDLYTAYSEYAGIKCVKGGSPEGQNLQDMSICAEKGSILEGKILGSNNPEDDNSWVELVPDMNKVPGDVIAGGKLIQEKFGFKPDPDSDNNEKKIEYTVTDPKKVQYIKIVSTKGVEDEKDKTWMSGNLIQLFRKVDDESREPTASIEYSSTGPTNDEVVARIANVTPIGTVVKPNNNCKTNSGQPVKVGDDGKSYIFSDNGECEFDLEFSAPSIWGDYEGAAEEAVDGQAEVAATSESNAVYKNSIKATVQNITRSAPTPTLKWTSNKYDRITNQTVSVDLEFDDDNPVLVYDNGIVSLNDKGQPVRELDGALIGKFMKSKIKDPNAGDEDNAELIDAMIDPTMDLSEEGSTNVIQKASDVFHYDFMSNTDMDIHYIDRAGNTGVINLSVDNIDNVPPVAIVDYSTTTLTDEPVDATVKFYGEEPDGSVDTDDLVEEDGVTITAIADKNAKDEKKAKEAADSLKTDFASVEEGSHVINFTGNGELLITYKDAVGNVGETEAKVDWFADQGDILRSEDESVAKVEKSDDKTKKSKLKVKQGTTVKDLVGKLKSDYASSVNILDSEEANIDVDKDREKLVGTGMKAGVFGNNYTIIVAKDADGDGEVTVKDVRRTHEHYVEIKPLEAPLYEAVDYNNDGRVLLDDIAKLHKDVGDTEQDEAQIMSANSDVELEEVESEGTDGEGAGGNGIKVGDTVKIRVKLSELSKLNTVAGTVPGNDYLKFVGCESEDKNWLATCNTENGHIVASRAETTDQAELPMILKFEATSPGEASVRLNDVKVANDSEGEKQAGDTEPVNFSIVSPTVNPDPGGDATPDPGDNGEGNENNQSGNSGSNDNSNNSSAGNPGTAGNPSTGGSSSNDNDSPLLGGLSNGGSSSNSAASSHNVVTLALVDDDETYSDGAVRDVVDGEGSVGENSEEEKSDTDTSNSDEEDFIDSSDVGVRQNPIIDDEDAPIVPILIVTIVVVAGGLLLFAYSRRN